MTTHVSDDRQDLPGKGAASALSEHHQAGDLLERDPVWTIELSEEEQQQAASIIDRDLIEPTKAAGIKTATPEFFNAAEIVDGALPGRARAALAALRRGTVPAVLIRGLSSDPDPGPTPTMPGVAADDVSRGNGWVSIVVRKLGDEFGYAMEKKGSLVHSIYPTREGAESQSNAAFKVELSLHTENAFHPIRPDWVVLYCVRAPSDPPATRLVVLDDVLVQLTDDEIEVLRQKRFNFRVVDSHRAEGEADIELCVAPLDGSPRRPVIRWHETIQAVDDIAGRAAQTFTAAAHQTTRHLKLREGDLLAFANEFCLHGRDRFDAALDGSDRWLLRGYALRDLTRTTAFVAPVSPRVTRIDLSTKAEPLSGK